MKTNAYQKVSQLTNSDTEVGIEELIKKQPITCVISFVYGLKKHVEG